jgi:hypothetical protein
LYRKLTEHFRPEIIDVKVLGSDDKRQITALLAFTLSGKLLSMELIYQGLTDNTLMTLRIRENIASRIGLLKEIAKCKRRENYSLYRKTSNLNYNKK